MNIVRAFPAAATAEPVTRVLLVRHAVTDAVGASLAGRTIDSGLNAQGRDDARRVSRELSSAGLCAVYSSPRRRARETAASIAAAASLSVEIVEALDEVDFGTWSGRSFDELAQRDDWRHYNAARGSALVPGGERPLDTQARVVRVLADLAHRHSGQTIAAVTHAEIVRYALLYARGRPIDDWPTVPVPPLAMVALACGADHVSETDAWRRA